MVIYKEWNGEDIVEESEAFEYAFDRVQKNEEDRKAFFEFMKQLFDEVPEEKNNFVEWFYSGNWIKKDTDEE